MIYTINYQYTLKPNIIKLYQREIKKEISIITQTVKQPVVEYKSEDTTTSEPSPLKINSEKNSKENLKLTFKLPKRKALEIGKMINLLDRYFNDIEISIKAKNGKIPLEDYETKILETLRQLDIDLLD